MVPELNLCQSGFVEKDQIIHAFNEGFRPKPETTFCTPNEDVLALHNPVFKLANFCGKNLNSAWRE
jgi:hypothetical protein